MLYFKRTGKILAGGWMTNTANQDFAIARYDVNGLLDPDFGINGIIKTDFGSRNDIFSSIDIQADGKIVGAGYSYEVYGQDKTYSLARYLSDLNVGTLDFAILNNSIWIYPNPIVNNAILEFKLERKEICYNSINGS